MIRLNSSALLLLLTLLKTVLTWVRFRVFCGVVSATALFHQFTSRGRQLHVGKTQQCVNSCLAEIAHRDHYCVWKTSHRVSNYYAWILITSINKTINEYLFNFKCKTLYYRRFTGPIIENIEDKSQHENNIKCTMVIWMQ